MLLEGFLNTLNEETSDDIVNITNSLGEIALFDDDGEFRGWSKKDIDIMSKQEFDKMKNAFVSYAKKLGFKDEASSMYLLFAAYEGGIESEKELKELASELEEYK